MNKKEYNRRFIDKRIANRQCIKCGDPLDEKETHRSCEVCRGKQSVYMKRRREKRVAAGKCPQCNRPAQPGYTLCRKCRIITNAQKRVAFQRKMDRIALMRSDY